MQGLELMTGPGLPMCRWLGTGVCELAACLRHGQGLGWDGIFVYPNTRARWRSMPVLPNLCVRVHAYTCMLVHAGPPLKPG